MGIPMTSQEAYQALLDDTAPQGMQVDGRVTFQKLEVPIRLPDDCYIRSFAMYGGYQHLLPWPRNFRCQDLSIIGDIFAAFPDDLHVENYLWLKACAQVTRLPDHLTLQNLTLRDMPQMAQLPDDLVVTAGVYLHNCPGLAAIPAHLRPHQQLIVDQCRHITTLPDGMQVVDLMLTDCAALTSLPVGLSVAGALTIRDCPQLASLAGSFAGNTLTVTGCTSLRRLPAGIAAHYVDISGCTNLEAWDDPAITTLRQLNARDCANLTALPPNLRQIDELDVSGCTSLVALPPGLSVTNWLDIGNTAITSLPATGQPYRLRWNGVDVSGQIAFHPETISAAMVLREPNAEVRRVLLERMGTERFIAEARPELRHADVDAGGPRRLLHVPMPSDTEDLVALQVIDPSTGRSYLICVPPNMQTCHQAAAWIAGFDDPDMYHPIAET